MFLTVYVVFLALSFVLVGLGLFRPEHTELSLIGFVFLFMLSFVLLTGNITIANGTNTSSQFNYTTNGNLTLLTSSFESVENLYTPISLEGSLAHIIGYWLAVGSFLGFLGILLGLRHSRRFQ